MNDIAAIMCAAPVIPVIVIDDLATAKPLAEALVAGGLPALEVTMRTPVALDAIRAMKEVPGAIVGAGTVVNTEQFEQVMDAGVEFIVSPGLTERLAQSRAPLLAPGVGAQGATIGDVGSGFGPASRLVLPAASRALLATGPDVAALREALREAQQQAAGLRRAPQG